MTSVDAKTALVTVLLWVESTAMTAEELSAALGVNGDRCHSKGELRGRTGKEWAHNGWSIRAQAHTSMDPLLIGVAITRCLREVLQKIEPAAETFRNSTLGAERGILIGIIAASAPPIDIDAECINVIARLAVPIQVDLIT